MIKGIAISILFTRSILPSRRHLTTLTRDKIRDYIIENTVVTRESLTPEIALRLVTPECRLWNARQEECQVPDPFWAFYWPGGQAITRYILDNASSFRDRHIYDIGSGCGASAIAAKMVGAKHVTANDICQVAEVAVKINAALNDTDLVTSTDDLIGSDLGRCDLVILGDMFYDPEFTDIVYRWLLRLRKQEVEVYIGDPGRVYLLNHPIRERLKLLDKYELLSGTCLENNGFSQGFVWKFM